MTVVDHELLFPVTDGARVRTGLNRLDRLEWNAETPHRLHDGRTGVAQGLHPAFDRPVLPEKLLETPRSAATTSPMTGSRVVQVFVERNT
jgi:hypothetical protein